MNEMTNSTTFVGASEATITNNDYDYDNDGRLVSSIFSNLLGYFLGFASLMLYTPIGIRIYNQKSANGTTLTTWWLKVSSYTVSDIYSYLKNYPLSTYIEVLTITIEAMTILILVAHYQKQLYDINFGLCFLIYLTLAIYFLIVAPPFLVAASTLTSAGLNSAALVPQFYLNYRTKSKGDYSPVTAGLAGTGCLIRLWTTHQLANDDFILYINFGIAFVLNWCLFYQILYYGIHYEKLTFKEVFGADLVTTKSATKRQQQKQEFITNIELNNNKVDTTTITVETDDSYDDMMDSFLMTEEKKF